ncbi:disease resistance protein (TIR-NBS-LRR class), partial [Trifolium pratense]
DVKIYVAFGHGLIVKKTIVYLVSGQSIIVEVDDANMEVEPPQEVNMQPSLEVKVEQSPKPRSIFTRLPNRIARMRILGQQNSLQWEGANLFMLSQHLLLAD